MAGHRSCSLRVPADLYKHWRCVGVAGRGRPTTAPTLFTSSTRSRRPAVLAPFDTPISVSPDASAKFFDANALGFLDHSSMDSPTAATAQSLPVPCSRHASSPTVDGVCTPNSGKRKLPVEFGEELGAPVDVQDGSR